MPEFVMEYRDHAARAESDFVLGFIEALFFTESDGMFCAADWFTDEAQEAREQGQCSQLPSDVGYTDLHPDSLSAIRADCEAWQAANAALLAQAYSRGYDAAQAGRDYWFTRNGHGVGFWDREELEQGGLGAALSAACRYNEVHAWFGDHVEHGDAPFVYVDL